MKVFTVGMEGKQPEKSESPPPGYVASTVAPPLPMGPEVTPIIVRKSRGYKGILMVMLGVFLMAIFALTLSEMAYNRQRDENFFRLQWAQLKHRLGYDYGHPQRIIPINAMPDIRAEAQRKDEPPVVSTRTSEPAAPEPKIFIENQSDSSASNSAENEVGGSSSSSGMEQFVRDARLQFLRSILQRIKQNAEEMGFDGTMQVSVIEVEPQQMMMNGGSAERADRRFGSPSEDPRSDSFLDSFGEFHAPHPLTGMQESMKPSRGFGPWAAEQQPQPEFHAFEIPLPPFQQFAVRPEQMFGFRAQQSIAPPPPPPSDWILQRPELQIEDQWATAPQSQQPAAPQPQAPEFEHKSMEMSPQEAMGEVYGRKVGRMLQDLIAARLQNQLMLQQQQQQQQAVPQQPQMLSQRPNSMFAASPMEQQIPQPQPLNWWEPPKPSGNSWAAAGGVERTQIPFGNPPPPPPPGDLHNAIHLQAAIEPQQPPQQQSQQQPNAELSLSELSIGPQAVPPSLPIQSQQQTIQQQNGDQILQQQFPQPPPQFPVFIAPEDRIQIEPPQPLWAQQQPQQPIQQQQQQIVEPQPQIAIDPKPQEVAWTHHQAENIPSATAPSPMSRQSTLVDGEVQMPANPIDREEDERKLVILKKPEAEKEEEFSLDRAEVEEDRPSQLSELPFKELQGQLAAALAMAAAREAKRHDFESIDRTVDPVEAALNWGLPAHAQMPSQRPAMPIIAENIDPMMIQRPQQSVEPAPITIERNEDPSAEPQVDLSALKFPSSDSIQQSQQQQQQSQQQPQQPQHEMAAPNNAIFFQVDEPQALGVQDDAETAAHEVPMPSAASTPQGLPVFPHQETAAPEPNHEAGHPTSSSQSGASLI